MNLCKKPMDPKKVSVFPTCFFLFRWYRESEAWPEYTVNINTYEVQSTWRCIQVSWCCSPAGSHCRHHRHHRHHRHILSDWKARLVHEAGAEESRFRMISSLHYNTHIGRIPKWGKPLVIFRLNRLLQISSLFLPFPESSPWRNSLAYVSVK